MNQLRWGHPDTQNVASGEAWDALLFDFLLTFSFMCLATDMQFLDFVDLVVLMAFKE